MNKVRQPIAVGRNDRQQLAVSTRNLLLLHEAGYVGGKSAASLGTGLLTVFLINAGTAGLLLGSTAGGLFLTIACVSLVAVAYALNGAGAAFEDGRNGLIVAVAGSACLAGGSILVGFALKAGEGCLRGGEGRLLEAGGDNGDAELVL